MFTGIIEHVGELKRVQQGNQSRRLGIDLGPLAFEVKEGDSVAINGVCLTATAIEGSQVYFDAVSETLGMTSLGDLKAGGRVNLELAMRLGDRLGGHLVQGHIDSTGRVKGIEVQLGQVWLTIEIPEALGDRFLLRGSICVDGVSLTVASLGKSEFSIAIIPHTWSHTNLSDRRVGDRVNLETDVVGQWVSRLLSRAMPQGGGVSMEKLRDEGFLG